MERRKSERAQCRLRCELVRARERASGIVLDISEGGLSVQTQLEVEQGTALAVRIQLPNEGWLELEALVWHVRKGRHRQTNELRVVLGLMLAKAPEAYFELLPRATQTEPAPPADEVESQQPALAGDSSSLCAFRVRIRARSGPRTRELSLSAESDDEARSLAVAELGRDWDVLEIRKA